ncbi:hypothetical protein FHS16_001051 [Paenibacillus endophyticus]|uniref:Uncharacterized protein n=1 Tax=Paenibacillus endophyticus TaxID=1294268 RepID=A0A7W5G9J1_9BACL|nr:hypothetical protein [Paenibacillus endophyticus]MBB3151017.1 hypothetical protein [Paenibacillus endophyticus]
MLATMQREIFDRMDDKSLLTACFTPLIQTYKEVSSKNGNIAGFYDKLTSGQQALFVFKTYYSHVIESVQELYWWSAYFLAHEARWTALNEKVRQLGDLQLFSLLQDIEVMLRTRNHPILLADITDISRADLETDTELRIYFESAYVRFAQASIGTMERLSATIRHSPDSFVAWS